jgi:hypothetical protein
MDAQVMQTLAVAGIFAGAALYLGRRVLAAVAAMRRGGRDGGCAGGCGCPHE